MEIPGYTIEKQIAEGGMAAVYLAIQESLGRQVALKLLKKFDKPEQSERFINEGLIIASLNQRNIITIHDIGVVHGQHYISMEYLEGGDLEKRIQEGIIPDAAIKLISTIAQCLDFIHSQGIIHRDIKPGNILFDKDDIPILTDFGIAKHLKQDTKLTMDGTAMGSPNYISPEQAECKPLDGRTDIYSLGIVLHEMITGNKPFQGGSYIETVMAHITAPIPSLPLHLKPYQGLLDRMIAKKPEDRFDSAADMIAYIDGICHATPVDKVSVKVVRLVRNLQEINSVDAEPTKTVQINKQDLPPSTSAAKKEIKRSVFGRLISKSKEDLRNIVIAGVVLILAVNSVLMISRTQEGNSIDSSQAEIEQYLLQAKVAMESDKLTIPADDNAYLYYLKVIALNPENEKALEGLIEIAERYADMTEWQLEKHNYEKAKRYVDKGLGIQPENPRLLGLEKKASDALNTEIEQFLLQAKVAMESDKLTIPADDNAYLYYLKVIALNPENEKALEGLVKIGERYADMAEWQLGKYNYSKAKRYVHAGLDVQPNNRRLLALQQRTNALNDIPDRMFRGIKSVFD